MSRLLRISAVILWCVAPFVLWLSLHRPFVGASGMAAAMPREIGAFELVEELPMTPRQASLLGTDEALWRTYRGPDGGEVFVVVVFHRENWKSVHPPDICLRGSNMVVNHDEVFRGFGRIVLASEETGRDYLSIYRYGTADYATGSYFDFFCYHAPRALFRAAVGGYLLRVETWIDGDFERAQRRCLDFMDAVTPALTAAVVTAAQGTRDD